MWLVTVSREGISGMRACLLRLCSVTPCIKSGTRPRRTSHQAARTARQITVTLWHSPLAAWNADDGLGSMSGASRTAMRQASLYCVFGCVVVVVGVVGVVTLPPAKTYQAPTATTTPTTTIMMMFRLSIEPSLAKAAGISGDKPRAHLLRCRRFWQRHTTLLALGRQFMPSLIRTCVRVLDDIRRSCRMADPQFSKISPRGLRHHGSQDQAALVAPHLDRRVP